MKRNKMFWGGLLSIIIMIILFWIFRAIEVFVLGDSQPGLFEWSEIFYLIPFGFFVAGAVRYKKKDE